MEQQLSLLDMLEVCEGSVELEHSISEILSEEDIPTIRENLIVETVKSAFGISRGGQNRKPSDEAWEWILSEDRELPFSFTQCCNEFGADPETVLDWLRWYRRKLLS